MPYSYCWVKKKLIRDQNKISILNIQHFWLWPEQGANRTKNTANILSRTRIKTAVSKDPVMAILGVILTTSGYPNGWVHLWGIHWKWEDAPLRWEDPCSIWVTFSLSKGQEKRKKVLSLLSYPWPPWKVQSSTTLEPTSSGFQSILKASWDTEPAGLRSYWILGLFIDRRLLLVQLDHSL